MTKADVIFVKRINVVLNGGEERMDGWSKGWTKSSLFLFLNIYFGGIHLYCVYRLRFVAQNIVSVIHERKKTKKKTFLMVFNGQKRHKKTQTIQYTQKVYGKKTKKIVERDER